jgi:8-amino-7-oxononanoate synthase
MVLKVDKFGVGAGASHLISGHTPAHQALEEELADYTGQEAH